MGQVQETEGERDPRVSDPLPLGAPPTSSRLPEVLSQAHGAKLRWRREEAQPRPGPATPFSPPLCRQRCFSGPCMAIWVPSGSLALIRAGQLGGDPLPLSWPQKQLTVFVKKEEGKE
ncbi:unnamed protein product [Rangifer tarandus platyrhynchus]|uniref:Uncharacterized protein n=1 Tax=Rangifer tarandus platyrhynchus TaxID=3082113 RepID=A0ABN8ZEN6_RANTA|nr:unnamed protein product [Rangifer tarandus platyrhynchus]